MGILTTKKNAGHDRDETFYFKSSDRALIIFTRNPELGKVKTRLAKKTGDRIALDIYKFLLAHTVEITREIEADKYVFYSEEIILNDLWDDGVYRKKLRQGAQLGGRMKNAFEQLFKLGYKKVMIVGSDIHELKQLHIEQAFESLENNDIVIGPAKDGGYYLLGMNSLLPELFEIGNWGGNTVFEDTMKAAGEATVSVLPERNDVDYFEDICDVEAFQPFLKSLKTK